MDLNGLTTKQAAAIAEKEGDNRLPDRKRISFGKRLLSNLSDPIIRILLVALCVNLLFTIGHINWAESIGIVLSILISAFVSTISEHGSEKAFDKLLAASGEAESCVVRDGQKKRISAEKIVKGDLLFLSRGERVPCDGFLVKGEMTVDESPLNGETAETVKTVSSKTALVPGNNNALLRGSFVCSGEGYFLAERVGGETLYGRIAKEIQEDKRTSPLKIRLQKLASILSKIGYIAAFAVAFTYLWSEFVIDSNYHLPFILMKLRDFRFVAQTLIHAVTIAVTVIVVAVPEGLPMMITVVLSANMKKMLRDGVLVRKLVGIETAGSMNLLLTDKTGTITTGKIKLETILDANGSEMRMNEQLRACILTGSDCTVGDGKIVGGNATERALFEAAIRGAEPCAFPADIHYPFDSARKYSAASRGSRAYYKGAPEILLPRCSGVDRVKMEAIIREYSARSFRLILLAASDEPLRENRLPSSLEFLGLALLRDPIRRSARDAVDDLRNAGIKAVMITGDSRETASAVAGEAGLLDDSSLILTSSELNQMSDYELRAALPHLSVVARALPQDKSRLVRIAQESGMVVGMTGDGVNDAPALKKADVGFSMGSGSEIAKEAGDVVILDDNLCSIVNAVLYGRTIFHSIRKFILFQLTMNLSAVGVSFFGQLMGIDNPVTVVQMLWVNLIMDTLGGLAFAGEPPLSAYLAAPPKKREESILTGGMLARILWMGAYVTFVCVWFLGSELTRRFYGFYADPLPFLTAYFALFIFAGIAVCFTSRSESANLLSHIENNKPFLFIMAGILAVQMLMLYFGGITFRCTPLSSKELLLPVLLALTVIPADFVQRIAAFLRHRSIGKSKRKNRLFSLAKTKEIGYNVAVQKG